MRRRLVALVLVLLVAVVAMIMIEADPGYVLISYGLTTVESSLWVALLLLVAAILLIYYLLRLLRGLIRSGGSLSRWWRDRREEQARKLSLQGVLNYLRGEWKQSRRDLLQAVDSSPQPAVNYLLAAQASNRLGDPQRAEQCYLDLETRAAEPLALALSRAAECLGGGDYPRAVAELERVAELAAGNVLWLTLVKDAYFGAGRWAALAALLPQLKKNSVLAADAQRELALRVRRELLREAGHNGLAALESAWSTCPEDLRRDSAILACYAAQLLANQAHEAAEKLLQKALNREWQPQLLRLFGLAQGRDPRRQLEVAEGWLQQHPDDAQFLLCLGRLALRNELWGKARSYFESSQRLQPNAETCAELARLLFHLGEREESARCYREGLMSVATDLPALPMPGQKPGADS